MSAAAGRRDYVFGWLIGGLFEVSSLADVVALKGGNALRKAYFPSRDAITVDEHLS